MPRLTADELDKLYLEAETADQEIFAEMRNNILLVSGDHYQRKGSRFWNRIRSKEDITKQQKLRLTKNHIKKITNDYVANILTHAPSATVMPNNPEEIQDQKTAELNNSVLEYHKKELKLRQATRDKGEDLVVFGEVCSYTFFDSDKGRVKGYEYLVDEDGFTIVDDNGEPIFDRDKPIMQGQFVNERILPFNLLRAPEAQSMDESPYLIIRKMVKDRDLKHMVDADMYDSIKQGSDETYMVFHGETGSYERTKNETMVRYHFYRPCKDYPEGYYYIAVRSHIIFEGELPFGIWPISWKGFDKIPTSPRGRSPIKQMRPYQIEINRSASAIATAQITLGDDKLILNHGSRMANGGQVPGVRGISVTGAGGDMKILPGRSGEQYVPYMNSQITELYNVMGVTEAEVVGKDGRLDPYALLYHSIKNKRKFSKYSEAFEEFNREEVEILLALSKQYLEPSDIIPMIGKAEAVNIKEFKNTSPNSYKITIESVDADAETMLGKQLAMNHTLQYVGSSLDKEDIGRIVRSMPYMNQEEAFDELTINYDNAKNDMLALERGELPPINNNDDHLYLVKRLTNRMRKPDFKFLDPQIQKNYMRKVQAHEMIDAKQKAEILRAQQGLIPTDGYLVTCDFYVTQKDGKTKRVRLPYSSVKWLIEQLQTQGATLEELEKLNQGAMAEMSRMLIENRGQARPQMQGGPLPQMQGQARPQMQGAL